MCIRQEKWKTPMQNIGVWKCAQCVIFPGRHQPSIVTASELNYCVRNGNRCALATMITHLLSFIKESKQRKFQFCAPRSHLYIFCVQTCNKKFLLLYFSYKSIFICPLAKLFPKHQRIWWPVGESNSCLRRERPPSWPLDQRATFLPHFDAKKAPYGAYFPFLLKRVWCTIGDSNPGPTD